MNILTLNPTLPQFNFWSPYVVLKRFQLPSSAKHVFNGGEVHLNLQDNLDDWDKEEELVIQHRLSDSDKIMEVLLAVNALREMRFKKLSLFMPYVMYARQDRVVDHGEPFSLKAFANLINFLNFENVYMVDPHSSVTTGAINNYVVIPHKRNVEEAITEYKPDYLIAPDEGAVKKTLDLSLATRVPFITAAKVRDLKNRGKVIGTTVHSTVDVVVGKRIFITDDICDGGATFIELAKVLREMGAASVGLFVTFGIFSKGLEVLYKHIDFISTTNGFRDYPEATNLDASKFLVTNINL
jgi:ribose-phosphate pyrophosphokinase